MSEAEGKELSEATTTSISIKIGRIQTAKANSPRFAKFVIKTPSGFREISSPVINEIMDIAYIERVQITTDRILVKREGRTILLQKLNTYGYQK